MGGKKKGIKKRAEKTKGKKRDIRILKNKKTGRERNLGR